MATLERGIDRPGPGAPASGPGARCALIALDRSDLPEAVVPSFLAQTHGSVDDLVLLEILPDWSRGEFEAVMRARLLRVASAPASSDVHVAVDVRRGEPVALIVDAARRHGADLIAMVEHPRGLADRLLLGPSVLESVARESGLPVLLLRGAGA
ncbi:MAG TPA: universal stress protein [Candidatus Methylomirabilis sp.]|nr:universal stress protein [Candidatus Methylomirabilis sp.]